MTEEGGGAHTRCCSTIVQAITNIREDSYSMAEYMQWSVHWLWVGEGSGRLNTYPVSISCLHAALTRSLLGYGVKLHPVEPLNHTLA